MSKTVLFLGASPTQLPPIRYALEAGYRVITTDNLPANPGHALAHRSYEVSTTDTPGILDLAITEQIDGIVAYASDPAAVTAAFVSEKMGLTSNPLVAVQTLTHKGLFRDFLSHNGFRIPNFLVTTDLSEASEWFEERSSAVFVKPVDSSGSKGVSRVTTLDSLAPAYSHALGYSRTREVLLEEEIRRRGSQVAGDGFVIDGILQVRFWADEHFDPEVNGLVPVGQTFPTSHDDEDLNRAHAIMQDVIRKLGLRQGALNFDFVFDDSGDVWILEIGPRNGGCRIPEVIRMATGVDLIQSTVETALGNVPESIISRPYVGYWSSYMLHSTTEGILEGVSISDLVAPHLVDFDLWIAPGSKVRRYTGSDNAFGTAILRFDSMNQMLRMMETMNEHLVVEITK